MTISEFRQEARELFNAEGVEGCFGMSVEYDDVECMESACESWAAGVSAAVYVRSLIESIDYLGDQDREDALFIRTRHRLPNWTGD